MLEERFTNKLKTSARALVNLLEQHNIFLGRRLNQNATQQEEYYLYFADHVMSPEEDPQGEHSLARIETDRENKSYKLFVKSLAKTPLQKKEIIYLIEFLKHYKVIEE